MTGSVGEGGGAIGECAPFHSVKWDNIGSELTSF